VNLFWSGGATLNQATPSLLHCGNHNLEQIILAVNQSQGPSNGIAGFVIHNAANYTLTDVPTLLFYWAAFLPISFSIRLDYTSVKSRNSGEGEVSVIDPKKWAEGIEQERTESASQKAQSQAAFIAKRAIYDQEAPKLWPALREAFHKFCDAYNKERDVLYYADIGPKNFVVRRKDLPNVIMSVDGLANFGVGVNSKTYSVDVFEHGHGSVSYVWEGAPITPDEIAADAVKAIARL
jgi:hypothetical protein